MSCRCTQQIEVSGFRMGSIEIPGTNLAASVLSPSSFLTRLKGYAVQKMIRLARAG